MYTFGDIAGVEYFLSVHTISKSCHFPIFHQIERKYDVAHLPLMFYPYVKFKKKSIEYFRVMAWTRSRTDGQTARRTDGQAETYIPSIHGGY